MIKSNFMTMGEGELLSLMATFPPQDFREELFLSAPPILLVRDHNGNMLVVAMSDRGAEALNRLCGKYRCIRRLGEDLYLILKPSMMTAFERFMWLARRSWRDGEALILWSLIYAYSNSSNEEGARRLLSEILDISAEHCWAAVGTDPSAGLEERWEKLRENLSRQVSLIPPDTYRRVVEYLCTYGEAFVEDISRIMVREGVAVNTVYKILANLKRSQHVRVVKHVRVSSKGPMRELLASNCHKCFNGFSSSESCFRAHFNELCALLKVFYGRRLSQQEKDRLYLEFRAMPYCHRVVKKVNDVLISFSKVRDKLSDKLVNSMLKRLRDATGIDVTVIR